MPAVGAAAAAVADRETDVPLGAAKAGGAEGSAAEGAVRIHRTALRLEPNYSLVHTHPDRHIFYLLVFFHVIIKDEIKQPVLTAKKCEDNSHKACET